MNDSMKTTIYVGASLFVALIAFITTPRPVNSPTAGAIGQPIFPDFNDPLQAKSLEIVQFDDKLAQIHAFKVAQNSQGRWVIPSHGSYPADADNQLKEAATLVIGLQSLGIATDTAAEHKTFGVIAPDKEKLKPGDEGVGTLVKMEDEQGKNLAHLVIGAKVKNADDQRFVRVSTQDRVYVVKLNLDKLSTKFESWIEKNLLKLNALDVERIRLKDYSVLRTAQGFVMDPRVEATVKWDGLGNKWNLEDLASFKKQDRISTQLLEDEEVNSDKLNAMKTALVELQIIDVQRKPKGLTADLQAAKEFLDNPESIDSLFSRGFFPLSANGKDTEVYSANGEVYVGLKDGVECVLRFGNIAKTGEGSEEGKLNRYLFVTARVDEAHFPPPNLEPEPADVPTADSLKPSADEPKKDCDDDPPAKVGSPSQAAPDDEKKDESKKPEVKQPDPKADLDRIKKENLRRQNEWRDKKKKAADKVAELNARFADWYYVISEDTYKKIHLGRADIIRERTGGKDEGYGPDAFRKLQQEGLKKGGKPDDLDHLDDGPPGFPNAPRPRP